MKQSENQMGTKAIFPLLMGMSVPPMISMLIQSLYNIVDSIFVAKLGEEALTAVSLAYPLQNLVLAVAVGLGVAIRSAATQNNITMLTSLDTVKVLLDVLEEVTIGISTIDAE